MAVAELPQKAYCIEQTLPSPLILWERSKAIPFHEYQVERKTKSPDLDVWVSVSDVFAVPQNDLFVELRIGFETELNDALDEIRSLDANWDEDGALKPDTRNIDNAEMFVRYAFDYLSGKDKNLPAPEMNPLYDGSVDVVWRLRKAYLLINFRNPEEGFAYFYFDRYIEKLGVQAGINLNDPSTWEELDIRLDKLV